MNKGAERGREKISNESINTKDWVTLLQPFWVQWGCTDIRDLFYKTSLDVRATKLLAVNAKHLRRTGPFNPRKNFSILCTFHTIYKTPA